MTLLIMEGAEVTLEIFFVTLILSLPIGALAALGRIVVRGLTPGMTVTVKETRAAAGYAPDGTPKSIAIQSGDAQ